MKKILLKLIFLIAIICSSCSSEKTNYKDLELKNVNELIERITPNYSSQFVLEKIEKLNGKDVFEIDFKNDKIILRGNNGVSIASAFNWYLKYECNAHVSWVGDQLNLPETLPLPTKKTQKTIDATERVYMNYCTLNYSASWWDWERWEREIDIMAMNGINMPLAVVGLEGVWYKTLMKHGFTDLEARSFLVGPAYFAWQWMTNIQSQGGPLPKNWIDTHIKLGQKIINRQLAFGMRPIQQGFTGFVPRELIAKNPKALILQEKEWCGFEGTAQLDPLDPLFKKIGKTFYETEKELFGAHGVYAADPFHEGHPPNESKEYMNKVGNTIYELMSEFDPSALWAMQSWSIRKDIATVVPKDKLLILSLNGGVKHKDFWGYNFVVGNLHNFGGRINMHGDLNLLASNQYQNLKKKLPNATGSGLFMESIGQNPVYYDLAFEMAFHKEKVDIQKWLNKYALRRYGKSSETTNEVMKILLENPYRRGTNGVENSSIIAARPAVNVKKSGPNAGFNIPYKPEELVKALQLLLTEAKNLQSSDAYRFDIVDIQRQVLSNLGQLIHKKAAKAFENKDQATFKKYSQIFLNLLDDADKVLNTRSEFMFDKWVADARKWGKTEEEKALYELNASLLVTHWGADGDAIIFDYSWREWSGLIKNYYKPRWKKFYTMLDGHLTNRTSYIEKGLPLVHGRETLRANSFYDALADWETSWIHSTKNINPTPKGDEVLIVKSLLEKYKPLFKEFYTK